MWAFVWVEISEIVVLQKKNEKIERKLVELNI